MSKEKALQELESLRGKVSDFYLSYIIEDVKRDFDKGFGSPAVLVDINDSKYLEKEEFLTTVMVSFQGAVDITEFHRAAGKNERVTQCHIKPEMIDWMHEAKQEHEQAIRRKVRKNESK